MGDKIQVPEIKRGTIVEWGGSNLRVAKIRKDYAVCEIVASGRMLSVSLKDLAAAAVIR